MSSLPLFMLQTYLDLQILMFSSFFDPILKLLKSDTPVWQTGQFSFCSLAKFDHQHLPTGQTLKSNKSSNVKPFWEGGCDDDDICEFADKDDYPAVGSVSIQLELFIFLSI
jgi:hypothetical protein